MDRAYCRAAPWTGFSYNANATLSRTDCFLPSRSTSSISRSQSAIRCALPEADSHVWRDRQIKDLADLSVATDERSHGQEPIGRSP
jgi:hypothetical protein